MESVYRFILLIKYSRGSKSIIVHYYCRCGLEEGEGNQVCKQFIKQTKLPNKESNINEACLCFLLDSSLL